MINFEGKLYNLSGSDSDYSENHKFLERGEQLWLHIRIVGSVKVVQCIMKRVLHIHHSGICVSPLKEHYAAVRSRERMHKRSNDAGNAILWKIDKGKGSIVLKII